MGTDKHAEIFVVLKWKLFIVVFRGNTMRNLWSYCWFIRLSINHPFSFLLFRWVYWTDWADMAYIGRAGMDGRNVSAIITTKLEWPSALTIDYATNKIFFADSHLNFLE